MLLGLFIPVGLILALPSMVESVAQHYPNQVGRVNNLSSGVFNTANGLGEVIGPLFGAAMYEQSGFKMTSDVTSFFTFCYVFVFVFVLTNGIASIRDQIKKRSNPDEIEESKEEEDDVLGGKNKKYRKDKLFDSSQEYLSSNCSESLISQSDHKLSAASNYNKYSSNDD